MNVGPGIAAHAEWMTSRRHPRSRPAWRETRHDRDIVLVPPTSLNRTPEDMDKNAGWASAIGCPGEIDDVSCVDRRAT